MKKNSTGIKLVLRSLFRKKGELLYYLALALVAAAIGMAVPSSIGILTDKILSSGETQSVLAMGISVILTSLAGLFINILANRLSIRLQTDTEFRVFSDIYSYIIQMKPCDERDMSRRLIGTFQSFLTGIENFISSAFTTFIYGIQAVMIVVMMIIRDYDRLTALCLFLAILTAIILFSILLLKTNRIKARERLKWSDFYNFSKELLDNMEAVKSTSSEDGIMEHLTKLYDAYMPLKIKAENNSQWTSVILTTLSGIAIWLVFSISSHNMGSTAGETAVIISMFSLLMGYLSTLSSSIFGIASSKIQLDFATEVLKKPVEPYGTGAEAPKLKGDICLSHVNFSYKSNGLQVIQDMSLNIQAGEYIGIVGPSGCGKSTLLRLLLGFEKPDSGTICFDGVDVSDCDVRSFRRQFGVVLQDASLISGSIATNIGLSENPDMDKVEKAAITAGIYQEIMDMPMKFQTILSGESELISGGQRQRIVLARALFNEPEILLLDEATSAMDNLTQKIVKDNLDKLGITRIIVAHRLSTVRDCDRIVVLNKGKIEEEGNYDELMKKNGFFASLARRNLK